eukprot:1295729-Alexandrium_andersonii.AAC.1
MVATAAVATFSARGRVVAPLDAHVFRDAPCEGATLPIHHVQSSARGFFARHVADPLQQEGRVGVAVRWQ